MHLEETLMKLLYMSFLIKDDELLKKNIVTFGKKLKIMTKKFDSEPIQNEKYLKVKIKSYNFTIIKYQKKVLNAFVYQ